MPRYVVGDIQGCFDEFIALLSLIEFNPKLDKVYLVGDLVNRGPHSLEVLRYVHSNRTSIQLVLGNHDLHLLACWAGTSKPKSLDTLSEILQAADVEELLDWLRKQPLMLELADYFIVHAGINPTINFKKNAELAAFCNEMLLSDDFTFWLANMYGNTPVLWSEGMSDVEKFRFGINSFTRMRMINSNCLDMKYKGSIENAPHNLIPWFVQSTVNHKKIVFGHWSALGLITNEKVVGLDTGCVWGGQLTAFCLDNGALFQYPALVGLNIAAD